MLNIENVNHIGIRIRDKSRSVAFYQLLGFEQTMDTGFEDGHPIIMQHPSGVVLNLLGPATGSSTSNILMDVDEKHPGITHFALTVSSLEQTKLFLSDNGIELTGSFSFGNMSAVFIRDPDRNVIELDAYESNTREELEGYSNHL
ncbi:MAG: VOC family protein [Proteobacteria bacterium]|nr:VOC family protein [Pseudomonadota bacterium]